MAARQSDPNTVRSKARARRGMILAFWWGVVLLGLFAVSSGGPPLLIVPVILIAIIVASNTIVVIRGTGPEQQALAPGRLARADTDDDPVMVTATRAPRRNAADRTRRSGELQYGRRRLRFTFNENRQSRADAVRPFDPSEVVTVFDVAPNQVRLGARPTMARPALTLTIDDTMHVIEFSPPMDLGAGVVGAIVAAAWYDQLLERGARQD
ncbi:MAG: hypothetical protein EBX39_04695 [Actinobacteria bacterium]|nr:hypothetical protein [Actinomycetota bacterium]